VTDLFIFLGILFLALFFLDLLITSADFSLTSVSRARLLALRQEQTRSVERALALLDSPRRLAVSQASLRLLKKITLFLLLGLVLALLIEFFAGNDLTASTFLFHTPYLLAILGLLAFLAVLLTWSESLIIERVNRQPEKWLIQTVSFTRFCEVCLSPLLIMPFIVSSKNAPPLEPPAVVTEDELRSMVDASQQEGILEQEERKMIYSIFDLGDTIVREIMVPRIDVLAIDVNDEIDHSMEVLLESGYSRVPVYEEVIDNIVGLLYTKDLFKAWHQGNPVTSLREVLRPAYFVPEAKKADELLAEMQSRRIHMAIAVDEYGGVAGLVTLEDIVEEIVGEIRDEFDDGEEVFYEQIGDQEYLCSGRMDLDDINDMLNSDLPVDEADTLAGLIYSRVGHVPIPGESLVIGGLRLTVEQVHKRRIRQVLVQRYFDLSLPEQERIVSTSTQTPTTASS